MPTKKEISAIATNGNIELTGQGVSIYEKLNEFVKTALKENEHYGQIQGTHKPSLFKGGAELINKEAQLIPDFEILHEKIDFETPFFAYTFKCTLYREGAKVSEGYGACNSKERKYTSNKTDQYFLQNVILKIAKKRAYVDATITAWGLSGIFTQDIEDLEASTVEEKRREEEEKKERERQQKLAEEYKNREQTRREKYRAEYFAQEKIKSMTEEQRHEWNEKYIGKRSTKDFFENDWKKAIELARLQSNPIKFEVKEEDTHKLLTTVSDKLNIKQADILNFLEAGYIASDKDLTEDINNKLREILETEEEKFLHSFNMWKKWTNKHNGNTEALINALCICKQKDKNIVNKFLRKSDSKYVWYLTNQEMEEWQQTLADIMADLDIESSFITKVCPEAVPF